MEKKFENDNHKENFQKNFM